MGDYHTKQLKDRKIPAWDCLKPLAGFSLCVASLGHPNHPHTHLGIQQEAIRYLPKIIVPLNFVCRYCQHGKQTRANFKIKEHMTSHPLEIIHTNLCGTTRIKIL